MSHEPESIDRSAPMPSEQSPLPEPAPDVEREVAEAMAAMSPAELALLSGDVPVSARSGTLPEQVEPGTEVTATVVGVTDDEVFLDLGTKLQGALARSQFGKKETIDIGRRVDVVVEGYDADSGLLNVARKGQARRAAWTTLAIGNLVEGRVTGLNKGGLEVDLKGIRAFMPASQCDVIPMKDISVLLNQVVQCEVIEVDRRHRSVLLSRRRLLERQLVESREKLLTELEVGQTRKGKVGNITDFGAFVDLGGVDGLIHISDLAWSPVAKVTDVLQPGQEVEVKVLKIDRKRNRISLGFKQAQPDPWIGIETRYPVGTQLKVRATRLADFGVFAELEQGVEGLVPISELSWSRVARPGEVVTPGDMVDAVLIRVEEAKRRIALSMKQAQPDPWSGILESFSPHSLVTGKVTRLADFGAFVELVPGVEGLVHISEMSDQRVRSCEEVVQAGQEVTVRVLGVDAGNRRISLSLRAARESAEVAEMPAEDMHRPSAKQTKKRKKPLRGGLAWDWGEAAQ